MPALARRSPARFTPERTKLFWIIFFSKFGETNVLSIFAHSNFGQFFFPAVAIFQMLSKAEVRKKPRPKLSLFYFRILLKFCSIGRSSERWVSG